MHTARLQLHTPSHLEPRLSHTRLEHTHLEHTRLSHTLRADLEQTLNTRLEPTKNTCYFWGV